VGGNVKTPSALVLATNGHWTPSLSEITREIPGFARLENSSASADEV
jgi:hypothetical protein